MHPRPLKLMTLNTWCGRVHNDLMAFLATYQDTDIFCLQEISYKAVQGSIKHDRFDPAWNLFEEIEDALPGHQGFFRKHYMDTFGLATFVKSDSDIEVINETERFVHLPKPDTPVEEGKNARNLQAVTISVGGKELHIFNFHGLWTGGGKDDTASRLEQSRNISKFVNEFGSRKILCGDFNLNPETQSVKILQDIPMRDLVKEYGVQTTRTSYYPKSLKFADYIFVDDAIDVKDFKVLPDEVSDHSPLLLIFE